MQRERESARARERERERERERGDEEQACSVSEVVLKNYAGSSTSRGLGQYCVLCVCVHIYVCVCLCDFRRSSAEAYAHLQCMRPEATSV